MAAEPRAGWKVAGLAAVPEEALAVVAVLAAPEAGQGSAAGETAMVAVEMRAGG